MSEKIQGFWDIIPCPLVTDISKEHAASIFKLYTVQQGSATELLQSFKMFATVYQLRWYNELEDLNHQWHCCENIKCSYISQSKIFNKCISQKSFQQHYSVLLCLQFSCDLSYPFCDGRKSGIVPATQKFTFRTTLPVTLIHTWAHKFGMMTTQMWWHCSNMKWIRLMVENWELFNW